MFTKEQLRVIEYCAEEVKRQGDTPNHVYHMLDAWEFADQWKNDFPAVQGVIGLSFIEELGKLVAPEKNANGFRQIPIGISNGWLWKPIGADPENIEEAIETLLYSYYNNLLRIEDIGWGKNGQELSQTAEDEFYFHFETIHPFTDGNGRTGKILYNYLSGTLDNPIWPPNFWGVSNP